MKKAIILGGTHDHIRLLEILKLKGYYTILIDYLENPPAKLYANEHIIESTLNHEAVLEIANRIKPDLLIATCIDQALLTMAFIAEELGMACHISYKSALALTNKILMKSIIVENDIPTSHYFVLKNNIIDSSFNLTFPLVVKPSDSNSSKGISKVANKPELTKAIQVALEYSRSHEAIVEEFKEGEEYSVDIIIKDFEPIVLLVTKNIKAKRNEGNLTIVQNLYVPMGNPGLLQKIVDVAKRIALAYNLKNAPLLLQLIYNAGDISVIEFSSRIGGGSKHHFIKKLTGFDILDYFVEILLGNKPAVKCSYNYQFACMNYIYGYPGKIKEFKGFDFLAEQDIIADRFYYKTSGMDISGHNSSADRPAGFMVIADNIQELQSKIETADKNLAIISNENRDLMIHGLYNFNQ